MDKKERTGDHRIPAREGGKEGKGKGRERKGVIQGEEVGGRENAHTIEWVAGGKKREMGSKEKRERGK